MAERVAFAVRVDLRGLDLEHEDRIGENLVFLFIIVVKGAVAYLVFPASVPLGSLHLGEAFERTLVDDPNGVFSPMR